jgi:hypothetical protein
MSIRIAPIIVVLRDSMMTTASFIVSSRFRQRTVAFAA